MAYVTSLFARKIVAAAGSGIDPKAMLASVGIDHDAPWDPKAMIAAVDYYDMLEAMAEKVDVTELPVHVGASMRCDEYGALGLAWKAAPTLAGSCRRIERYARLWTGVVSYELRPSPRGMLFILHRMGDRRLGLRLSNEATLASSVSLIRQICPVPFSPMEVFVQHPPPKSTAFHEEWFGCPVTFGAELDAILISQDAMERPNILGDEGISRYLISDLETELAHGVSFQALTEDTRRELAEGLLRDEQYTLADVAFLTGFAEQSSFTRAFKRWIGKTPASYRKAYK